MLYRILAGSYTNEIYTLDFDPSSSSLASVTATTVGYHPSWIAYHPDDHSLIFAALEGHEGKVVAVKFGANGEYMGLGQSSSGGADPCSVLVTADELIIGNVSCLTLGKRNSKIKFPEVYVRNRGVSSNIDPATILSRMRT